MEEDKKREYIKWYNDNHSIHKSFSEKIEKLIKDLIDVSQITYHSITSRVKEEESFLKKCDNEKYDNPINEIMDVVGIRIITYINSDVNAICEIIKNEFVIDQNNSINKADQLGENQVGYLSIHYIASLNEDRASLSEYKKFKGLRFEIQIRTLLQHAWAEIEHDRNYKFGGVLPKEIRRRFFLAAGTLEMLDREFQNLSDDIDRYSIEVKEKAISGNLDIPIDSTSLFEYLSRKLDSKLIEKSFNAGDKNIIDELFDYGIYTLGDIEKIIPDDYITSLEEFGEASNLIGSLRDIMIINDYQKYFSKCWKRHWRGMEYTTCKLYKKYGLPVDSIISAYNLDINYEEFIPDDIDDNYFMPDEMDDDSYPDEDV